MTNHPSDRTHGWCSLRLRFEARELQLLRAAEQVRGSALARTSKPGTSGLRSALGLAKAAHKLGNASARQSISLDEQEVGLLVEALRFTTGEVQWASRLQGEGEPDRRQAVLQAFPELVERGLWRGFGLSRELEALGQRLEHALVS
jgi:hypothetical protein